MERPAVGEPAELAITRTYPVAPEKVWRAWTDPQALIHWFGAGKLAAFFAATTTA